MLRLLRKSSLKIWPTRDRSTTTLLCFLQNPFPKTISHTSNTTNQSSLTVSYLINSCGFSREAALVASNNIHLQTTEKPDYVLALLKDYGFTNTQITSLVTKRPLLLLANAEKTLKPKLEFFLGVGYSGPNLGKLLSSDPNLLLISLEKRIVPNFNLLKDILGTSENFITALTNSSRILRYNLLKMMVPNIETLRNHGVPGSKISKLLTLYPRVLLQRSERFKKTVETLKVMGLDASTAVFIFGINVLSGLTALTWERKFGIYKSLDWSDNEILLAFRKHPYCMLASDKKIRRMMEFFVKKLGWNSTFISARPKLLSLSFEKRIAPRCSVLSILMSKGLISRNMSVHTFLLLSEKKLLEKYVIKYREQVPEILEAYQGKIEFGGFKMDEQVIGNQEL